MKELSIKEKAKSYDEAIERARKLKENPQSVFNEYSPKEGDTICDYIFPELKESEDEKIRKEIIEFLELPHPQFVGKRHQEDWIVWLEKQGEQNPTLPKWKYKKDNTPLLRDSIILNKYGCVAKSPSGAIVSDVWVIDYDELAKLPKEEFEKQDEQKDSVVDFKAKDWYVSKVDGKIHNIYHSVDKVEPKFKVGDWIYHNNGYRGPYLITNINEHGVELDNNIRIKIEDCYDYHHLWTIQDAKDGDVLAINPWSDYPSSFVTIYKKQNEEDFDSYCFVGFDGKFYKGENGHSTEDIHPATKEQRELLFQKMKEARYEWNLDTKELKKIEQKLDKSDIYTWLKSINKRIKRMNYDAKSKKSN